MSLLWPRMVGAIVGAVSCATSAHALITRTDVQPSASSDRVVGISAYPARQGPLLPTGTRVSIRLLDSVKGDQAAIGTKVRALVIAPVAIENRLALGTGVVMNGAIVDAGVEPGRGQRHYVTLAFYNLTLAVDTVVPMAAQVVNVPNARDTVDSVGRIVGPERPGVLRSPENWAALVLGTAVPLAGITVFAAFHGVELERHRHIVYGPGVEMVLRLTVPLALPTWPVSRPLPPVPAAVLAMLADAPVRTTTAKGRLPADIITIALVGTAAEVAEAFRAAGWTDVAGSSVRADYKTLVAAAEARGFAAQPVSTLELEGVPPRLAFEKVVNSMARRHHLRIWPWGGATGGRELWLVAATRDDGIMFSRARRSFTHRVDPDMDAERQKVVDDLLTAGVVASLSYRARTPPVQVVRLNDDTTPIVTDWRVVVLVLAPPRTLPPNKR